MELTNTTAAVENLNSNNANTFTPINNVVAPDQQNVERGPSSPSILIPISLLLMLRENKLRNPNPETFDGKKVDEFVLKFLAQSQKIINICESKDLSFPDILSLFLLVVCVDEPFVRFKEKGNELLAKYSCKGENVKGQQLQQSLKKMARGFLRFIRDCEVPELQSYVPQIDSDEDFDYVPSDPEEEVTWRADREEKKRLKKLKEEEEVKEKNDDNKDEEKKKKQEKNPRDLQTVAANTESLFPQHSSPQYGTSTSHAQAQGESRPVFFRSNLTNQQQKHQGNFQRPIQQLPTSQFHFRNVFINSTEQSSHQQQSQFIPKMSSPRSSNMNSSGQIGNNPYITTPPNSNQSIFNSIGGYNNSIISNNNNQSQRLHFIPQYQRQEANSSNQELQQRKQG